MATVSYRDSAQSVQSKFTVTVAISAQNQFSDWAEFLPGKPVNISIPSGLTSTTVVLQRSFDAGSTAVDVDSWTAAAEEILDPVGDGVLYRLGVKTGGFGSGTATLRMMQ